MEKRLYKDEYRKKIGGVCAGLAEYFDADVTLIRVLFVASLFLHGIGFLPYIVLWIVLPKRPFPIIDPNVDYTVPPQNPGSQDQTSTGKPYGGSTFQGNPYGSNPYGNNPFGSNPFPNPPVPPKHSGTSMAAIIIGVIMIVVGGSFLLENLDIVSWWDFWHFWPIIPITVGVLLMMSSVDRKPKTKDQIVEEAKPEENNDENKADAAPADDAEPKA